MKLAYISFVLTVFMIQNRALSQPTQLTKLWESDTTLQVPESVYFDAEHKMLYVSNIVGKSDEKDLVGYISQLSLDGKIVNLKWATNLSAPKGLGMYQDKLYVADLSEIVVIDRLNGKILKRINVPGAIFLNDITVDDHGVVYVSDSRTGKVHMLEKEKVSTFLEKKKDVNGLFAKGTDLFLVAHDTLFRVDKSKAIAVFATGMDRSTDGIAAVDNGFIVSCWTGVIYGIGPDGGKPTMLLDTRKEKSNTADIAFDPTSKTLYVPTFFKNKVVAYQVK